MKILVTNDDGIDAPGLHALARALVADGRDVVVVAPARDMSGSGAAIGQVHVDQSIDAHRVDLPGLDGVPAYALDGAPGLCVLATEDTMVGSDEMRRRSAERAGARLEVLDGLGHWWMVEDPVRGARVLTEFWSALPRTDHG